MQCSWKGQDQSATRYIASTHLCPNCHKIASIVRDWQVFTPRENRRSHQIGSWSNFRRAKDCVTCQSLVRLFDSTLLFNAFVSISASYNRKNLSIHLYEEGADQEELSVSRDPFGPRSSVVHDDLGSEHLIDSNGFHRLRPIS